MKRCAPFLIVLISLGALSTNVFGWLIPFSKQRIASHKHAVHGFDGNFGHVSVYYAGSAAAFNETIVTAGKSRTETPYVSTTVILHPGPMIVPKYVAQDGEVKTDWLISTWRGTHRGQSGTHMQIDVWLGGQIKLDELQIPDGFVVESGREIEDFVARRTKQGK